MANVVKILWSKITGRVPESLLDGQIAINQKDKKLFYPDDNGVIQEFYLDNSVKNIIKEATKGANVTGTVSETILYSKLIPANTFKNGDFMSLFSRIGKFGATSGLTQRIKINTSNTLSGAMLIAGNYFNSAGRVATLVRTFSISANNLLGTVSSQFYSNDLSNVNIDIESTPFDPTVDNYIFVTGQLANSADTMYHLGTKITN